MMRNESFNNLSSCQSRRGIVLLVTLVLLVVLSTLGYTLSVRLASQRHRDQYIIDYCKARYGCDSAVKYALSVLEDVNAPRLVERPNEPDFSDLFSLSEVEYRELCRQWVVENANDVNERVNDINDINDVNDTNDPNFLTIRGPYGPLWPFVTKPVEFKIGSVTVRVEVEDENAKYPIGWPLLSEKEVQREAMVGLETFCEWMDVGGEQVDSLKRQLKAISEIKTFKLKFEPIKQIRKMKVTGRGRRGRRGKTVRYRSVGKTIAPASVHTADFAELFHSSLIDTEVLARLTIASDWRKESALKYMSMWASSKVNINTAPRQVLEAAFAFGGDAEKIAEEIIQRRRTKPFEDIEDLRKSLFRYSDSIEKCQAYITTASRFFTIRITAVSGVAKASTIIAITKEGKKTQRIAIISG